MTEHRGPKLDIPSDLAEELREVPDGSDDVEAGSESSGEQAATAGEQSVDAPQEEKGESSAGEAALREEIQALKDRYLRMAAEYENQRRRALREQQDAIQFANENLIKELLGTVDNLERALGHARSGEGGSFNPEKLVEGVELTRRSLLNALERSGLERIEAVGAKFDPRLHEAMRQIPSADQEPNTIVEVYQVGYSLKGRLLRPALVAVASKPAEEPS